MEGNRLNKTREIINEILGWAWNFTLLAGITYYVFERDQSGWWYALFFLLHASSRESRKKNDNS